MTSRNIIAEIWGSLTAIAARRKSTWTVPSASTLVFARSPVVQDAARAPLSNSDQWAKLSGVLTSAIARADDAYRRQVAATQQLDLAQYALSTLVDELAAVMTVPGRRERAPVYRFEVAAQRGKGQALAA